MNKKKILDEIKKLPLDQQYEIKEWIHSRITEKSKIHDNALYALRDYFHGISDTIEASYWASTAFDNNNPDIGVAREVTLEHFLKLHIPKSADVLKGGYVFDHIGNRSKQVDIIISDDTTIRFGHFENMYGGKSFCAIEGIRCVISVKSTLNKKDLIDSIDNFASIPQQPQVHFSNRILVPPAKNEAYIELPRGTDIYTYANAPLCVIFAYDKGATAQTICENTLEYCHDADIPLNRWPDLIIVNNQFVISFLSAEKKLSLKDQTIIERGSSNLKTTYVGAVALFTLIVAIQESFALWPQQKVTFEKYLGYFPDDIQISKR